MRPATKPRIFSTLSRWPGVWLWRVSTDDEPPCNYLEWASAVRNVARQYGVKP